MRSAFWTRPALASVSWTRSCCYLPYHPIPLWNKTSTPLDRVSKWWVSPTPDKPARSWNPRRLNKIPKIPQPHSASCRNIPMGCPISSWFSSSSLWLWHWFLPASSSWDGVGFGEPLDEKTKWVEGSEGQLRSWCEVMWSLYVYILDHISI